jgi:hypothetical protein
MTSIYQYPSREEAEVENVGYFEVWYRSHTSMKAHVSRSFVGCYSLWTEA